MITEQDIDSASAEVVLADTALRDVRSRRGVPTSERGAALAAASGRAELARDALARLVDQRDADAAALAGRPALEADAASLLDTVGRDLRASQERLTAAAASAQAALVNLLSAAVSHNQLVRRAADELAAAGLALEDGAEHATGGRLGSGGVPAARVRGAWAAPVEPSALLMWMAHRVASARLGDRHSLTLKLRHWPGRLGLDRRADGLLGAVPEPAAADLPKPVRVQRAEFEKAPVFWRSERERADAEAQAARAVTAVGAGGGYWGR